MCEHFRWSSGLTTFGCRKRIVNKTSPSTACQVLAQEVVRQKSLYHNIPTTQKALHTRCKWTLDFLLSGKFSESVRKCFPIWKHERDAPRLSVLLQKPPTPLPYVPPNPSNVRFFLLPKTKSSTANSCLISQYPCIEDVDVSLRSGFCDPCSSEQPQWSPSRPIPIHFNTCYKIYSTFSRGNKARDAFAD